MTAVLDFPSCFNASLVADASSRTDTHGGAPAGRPSSGKRADANQLAIVAGSSLPSAGLLGWKPADGNRGNGSFLAAVALRGGERSAANGPSAAPDAVPAQATRDVAHSARGVRGFEGPCGRLGAAACGSGFSVSV